MAKACDSSVLDAALNVIKGATRMTVCSGQPANFAGITAVLLASQTMTGTDYTLAAGDATPIGRKITVAAKSGVNVTTTGTPTHVCLDNGTTLLYVTTCTGAALSSPGTVNIPTWKVDFPGPT